MEGPAYEMLDFMPQVFADVETPGFEKVVKPNPTHAIKLLKLSSSSKNGLVQEIKKIRSDLEQNIAISKDNSASGKYRQAILYRTQDDLKETIDQVLKSDKASAPISATKPKLCFLVTCQGTHFATMGKQIYSLSPIFRKYFDFCAALVEKDWNIDIKSFMLDPTEDGVVPVWMESPINFLPYLLALQYSIFKHWESWGIVPDYVLGLSFGEYGASAMAGIITIEEAFTLIMTRVLLMTKHIPQEGFCVGQMDINRLEEIVAEAKLDEGMGDLWFEIAAINSPKQTCIVSEMKYITKVAETCKKNNIKTIINPYHPYHSSLTKPILPEFLKTTESISYQKANCKFISTVNGKMWETLDPTYFLDHLKLPADFIAGVETAVEEGITHFLEIGPHPIQIQMVKDILQNNDPKASEKFSFFTSLKSKEEDKVALLNSVARLYVAGYDINWEEVQAFQTELS